MQAKQILSVLADMGELLHVNQNIELHNIIFLKPNKITEALEKTLDLNRVRMSYAERVALLQEYK